MSEVPNAQEYPESIPRLVFAEDTHVLNQQILYVVIALSQRKQSQIMNTLGKTHNETQPFPTWNLVGQAISQAFFNTPIQLKLKSTMEMHHRDYLLFENTFGDRSPSRISSAPAVETIFEVSFVKQAEGDPTWLGYRKVARSVVARLVRDCS